MTAAAIGPAIAAPIVSAAGRGSRKTETPNEGFGNAFDRAGPRSGQPVVTREAEPNQDRPRQHGDKTSTAAARVDKASVPTPATPEAKPEVVDVSVQQHDPLSVASTAAAGELEVEETGETGETQEIDTEASGDEDQEGDVSLPVQLRAHHAISAMMAIAPARPDAPPERPDAPPATEAMQAAPARAVQAIAARSAKVESLAGAAEHPMATPAEPANETAQAAASASETPQAPTTKAPLVRGVDPVPAVARQTNDVVDQRNPPAGPESTSLADAIRPARAAEAKGGQDTRTVQTQTSAAVLQQPASSNAGGTGSEQSNADSREERGATQQARRFEPQNGTAKVAVVSQQAAPAPVIVAPLNAAAAAIVSALDAQQGLRPAAGITPSTFTAAQPMRSLKIQLHPAELGVVTATLKAAGDRLSVELNVESREAYHRLSADSETIAKSLRALGYDVDRIAVLQPQAATTGTPRSDINAGTGSFSRDASSFQPGNSGEGGERFSGQAGGRGDRGDAQRGGEAQPVHRDRARGGLYI